MEHAVSDLLIDRIDHLLGNPEVDPHGDPIPSSQGQVARTEHTPLSDAQPGQPLQITRVIDQASDFLIYLEKNGLTPGRNLVVASRDQQGASLKLHLDDGQTVALGLSAARKILTAPAS